jgi:hypothetical protein
VAYIKKYIKNLTPLVSEARQEDFKKDIEPAVKWLMGKLNDLQL